MMNESSYNGSSQFVVPSRVTAVVWCVAFGFTGTLIVTLNVGTLITFAINKPLRRHGVYSLLNLATADMLLGLVMIPYYTIDVASAILAKQIVHPQILTTLRALYITTVVASLFCLALVSLQRMYATYCPFGYRAKEAKMLASMFTVPWMLAGATSLVFFLLDSVQDQIVIFIQVLFALSLGIILICYIAIFIKVKMRCSRQRHIDIRDRHLAGTVFMVTALSLITWIPSIVFHSIYKTQTRGFSFNLQLSIYLILCTNSLINPIVYLLRMKDFRKALFRLMTKCSAVGMSMSPVHYINSTSRRSSEVRLTSVCFKET
ncbi:sphingosine 1-phosphate receptor 3-like [Exaiptasia diaphana]|uniref:G-protein coupled receptors family 1 profile domain-containing protein n=1 Tax=Exaiptasia diaphana TaxID=2652724 RepID=A0A913YJL8_EXADI|nr:sphingosine 1-phosphate receptor 3-like [Exaiptasia diaphana]